MKDVGIIKKMVRIFIDTECQNIFANVQKTENLKSFVVASIEATSYKVAKAPYINGVGDLAYIMRPIVNSLIDMMNRVTMTQFVIIIDESRLVNIKNLNEFDKFVEFMRVKYPDLSPDIKINGDYIIIGGKLKLMVPQVVSTID